MKIQNDCVVAIHYQLNNNQGQLLDSSEGKPPLQFLHGAGNIIPGLEQALLDKQAGDAFEVTIEPEQAYGVIHPQLIQKVPKSAFQGVEHMQVGMRFNASSDQGEIPVRITEIVDDMVTVDGNHELAGEPLTFKVSVESVRAATAEEKAQGHAH